MAALVAYPWPGNVRALRHALERAVILCDGDTLAADDFPLGAGAARDRRSPRPGAARRCNLAAAREATRSPRRSSKHGGNISHAAQELGLTRTSLYRRMEKHGL